MSDAPDLPQDHSVAVCWDLSSGGLVIIVVPCDDSACAYCAEHREATLRDCPNILELPVRHVPHH
ncbi:hypothetical protein ES703_26813 [subsurface metagenome]